MVWAVLPFPVLSCACGLSLILFAVVVALGSWAQVGRGLGFWYVVFIWFACGLFAWLVAQVRYGPSRD